MSNSTHNGELGIQMIDRDHREIAELMIALNSGDARDGDPVRHLRRLRELERLVRSHFLLEETMMSLSRYPGAALHSMRHDWMMEQIRRLHTYWKAEKHDLKLEPMGLLWQSHLAHVTNDDMKYGLWLHGSKTQESNERMLAGFAAAQQGSRSSRTSVVRVTRDEIQSRAHDRTEPDSR